MPGEDIKKGKKSREAKFDLAHVREDSGRHFFCLRNIGKSCAIKFVLFVTDKENGESVILGREWKCDQLHPSKKPKYIVSVATKNTSQTLEAVYRWEDGLGAHEETITIPK